MRHSLVYVVHSWTRGKHLHLPKKEQDSESLGQT